MSKSGDSTRSVGDSASHELAAIAERFEAAWDSGPPPAIADFLPSGPFRQTILWELVRIDLERRFKAGEAVRVETYLERFPELTRSHEAALSLIAAERNFRLRADPHSAVDDYSERFPQYRTAFPWVQGLPTRPDSPALPLPEIPGYENLGELGRGGMGVVYRARHQRLDRLVAIKMLLRTEEPGFAERFQREAKALAALNHPNIVGVHDFGEAADCCFLVLEYVDGRNLRQRLLAGRAEPSAALAWMAQILDALQFAHDAGIVHRDIKPENILLDARERVKIADFGLAKLVRPGGQGTGHTLTSASQVMGTVHYMAPEQWWQPKSVDHRADIYSLGVLFYELLTGEVPIGRFEPPSRKSSVDKRFDAIVLRMLDNDPAKRFQHVREVQAALAPLAPSAQGTIAGLRTVPDSVPDQSGLSARFWLQTVGLAALGWLATAKLWSFGFIGLAIALGLMALPFRYQISRALQQLTPLEAAWRQRDLRHRYVNGGIAALLFAGGFAAVVAAHFISNDRPYLNPANYVTLKQGEEHDLLAGLSVEAAQPLQLVPKKLAPPSDDNRLVWLLAVGAVLLIPASVLIFLETVPYRDSWRHHWQPALVLGSAVLLGIPVVECATGMASLPGISRPRDLRAVDSNLQLDFDRSQLVAAPLDAVTRLLERWAAQNDYLVDPRGDWKLQTLADHRELAHVHVLELRPRSPFDRWQLTWQGWRYIRPGIYVRCVTAGQPAGTMTMFHATNLDSTDPSSVAAWEAAAGSLMAGLCEAGRE